MLVLFLLWINGALIDAQAPYWVVWFMAVIWYNIQLIIGDR